MRVVDIDRLFRRNRHIRRQHRLRHGEPEAGDRPGQSEHRLHRHVSERRLVHDQRRNLLDADQQQPNPAQHDRALGGRLPRLHHPVRSVERGQRRRDAGNLHLELRQRPLSFDQRRLDVLAGVGLLDRHHLCEDHPDGDYYCLTDTTFDGIDQQAQNLRKLQSGTWSVILNSTSFGADISAFCVNPNNLSQIIAFTVSGYCQASINGGSTWSGYANAAPGGVNYTGSITWQWAQTNFYLVVGNCEFDPRTPGQVLVSHGTGASTVTFPSSGSWPSGVMNWTTNSQGEESLVGNKIVCLPNNHGIIVRCDDFPIFKLDGVHYPSTYYPPGVAAFNNGFGVMVSDVDYASDLSGVALAHLGVTSIYSTDWGATWSALPNIPATGQGNVAVSTSTNWIYGEYGTGLWYTLNAGATWTAVTISGAVWAGYGGFSLVADRVTAGTFYIYIAQTNTGTPVLYKSTNGGASWTAVYTAGNTGGIFGSGNGFENPGILRAVPGQAGHLFAAFGPYVVGQSWAGNTYTLAFSNGGATWTAVGGIGVPFGVAHGPAAAGQSYPSIYVVGYDPTGLTFGLYRCVNFNPSSPGSATWTLLGGSNASFAPVGNIDEIAWLDADPTNYGKVYWSSNGEGYCQGYFP